MSRLGLAALAMLAFSACTSIRADARTFEGTNWQVIAINGHQTPRAGNFEMRFANGQVGGQFGCNNFGGAYRVNGDVLATGALAVTQMACEPAGDAPTISPMQYESWGFAVLGAPMRMTWKDGRRLTLSNSSGSIDLELLP
jgi:heat shock protein HslJ